MLLLIIFYRKRRKYSGAGLQRTLYSEESSRRLDTFPHELQAEMARSVHRVQVEPAAIILDPQLRASIVRWSKFDVYDPRA